MNGSTSVLWGQLDRPLKISSVIGLISGITCTLWLVPYLSSFLSFFSVAPFSPSGLIAFTLILAGPCLTLLGGMSLLMIPMSQSNRGILGFVVFIDSLIILSLMIFLALAITPVPQ